MKYIEYITYFYLYVLYVLSIVIPLISNFYDELLILS